MGNLTGLILLGEEDNERREVEVQIRMYVYYIISLSLEPFVDHSVLAEFRVEGTHIKHTSLTRTSSPVPPIAALSSGLDLIGQASSAR